MEEIKEFCCGKCEWYNGDLRDAEAFCDEKEEFVSRGFYCCRYTEVEKQIDEEV